MAFSIYVICNYDRDYDNRKIKSKGLTEITKIAEVSRLAKFDAVANKIYKLSQFKRVQTSRLHRVRKVGA